LNEVNYNIFFQILGAPHDFSTLVAALSIRKNLRYL
jgi:hypothetical protein